MNSFRNIGAQRRDIATRTSKQFPRLMSLFAESVSLLVDASAILESRDNPFNHRTADGASCTAAWRFLSTLPTSASWSFEAALNGDYGIAKSILRLTLEETVKLAYYVTFPDQALRQITRDTNKDEADIGSMLKKLEFEHRTGIMKLWGDISAFHSHANLNLPEELIAKDQNGKVLIGGGPTFAPNLFEAIVHQLLILIVNSLKYILIRFPKLAENVAWQTRFEKCLHEVADILPD